MIKNVLLGLALATVVAAELSTSVEVGSFVVSFDEHLGVFQVKAPGRDWSDISPMKKELKLKYGTVDPLALGGFTEGPSNAGTEKPYLIQFFTPAFDFYRKELGLLGVKTFKPFPEQALLAVIPSAEIARKVERLPYVRALSEYLPVFKVDESLQGLLVKESDSSADKEQHKFYVMVLERGLAMKERVADAIARSGGRVDGLDSRGFRFEASLTHHQLLYVATLAEVMYIDPVTPFTDDMDIVRFVGGMNYIETVAGYDGQGVRAEVMDSGLRTSHRDFQKINPIIHTGNGASTSHGTSVFGVVFGDGTADAKGRGGISSAEAGIFAAYSILNSTYSRFRHTEELVDPSGDYRAVFQTNSWGSSQTTSYNSDSADMDDIIFNTDLFILQSQSNTGNRNSRPQAWAKNIFSVGGFYHEDNLLQGDDAWRGSASIGPATDGRQKPDLCHFYDNVYTTSSSSDTSYTQFGGTSAATPITAGHAGLFFQMWADGVFSGSVGQKRDVFEVRPHSSTAKAVLINTAKQHPFNSESSDMIREHQGWGVVNVGKMYDIAKMYGWKFPVLVDESSPLNQGDVDRYTFSVTSRNSAVSSFIKVTLVYRDPMPAPSSSKQLINNLDLEVRSPSGVIYKGNHGLRTSMCSTPGGEADEADNVENVFICDAGWETGTWTVEVVGKEIVDGPAAYSLVATAGRNS